MKKFFVALLVIFSISVLAQDRLAFDFGKVDISKWGHTKSTTVKIRNGAAVIGGTTWDSKIWLNIKLKPNTRYRVSGEGKGLIMLRLSIGWIKELTSLNLSWKDWHENWYDFTTGRESKYILVLQVNAGTGRGEVRRVSISETAKGKVVKLDPAKLKANRPSPEIIRGFMSRGILAEKDFENMRDHWRANAIRYQLFLRHNAAVPDEKTIAKRLDILEKALAMARKYNFKVVIDLHNADILVKDRNVGFWQQPNLEKNFIKLWCRIVKRIQPYKDVIWGIDLMNEPLDRSQLPHPPKEWRPLAIKILKAIRKIDKDIWIVYEPGPGGWCVEYGKMQPLPDYRVIYSFHFYAPPRYTHQGIYNISATDLQHIYDKINVRYPGKIGIEEWNKDTMLKALKPAIDFQKKYPVPMYVGEFSVVRWAPGGDQYLKDCTDIFEKQGWSWTYHAYHEWSGWDLEYDNTYWIDKMGYNSPARPRKRVEGYTKRGKIMLKVFQKNRNQTNSSVKGK